MEQRRRESVPAGNNLHWEDDIKGMKKLHEYRKPELAMFRYGMHPALLRDMGDARLFINYERYYDRFMNDWGIERRSAVFGVRVKTENTVVGKWPFKLKKKPGHPGAMEELDVLCASCNGVQECYLEWARLA